MLWGATVWLLGTPDYLLPSPARVAYAFLLDPGRFISHAAATATEAFAGFVIGNSLGIALAVALHRYTGLRDLSMPGFISLQAIPIVSIAPLLVVWLGTGASSKIAMAAIICFFPMVVNTLQAFADVDRDFVKLFSFSNASYPMTLHALLLPACLPAITAALRISAGLSVVGAIVAELTGADRGLGFVLLSASYRLETPTLFVAIVLAAILGIGFYQVPSILRLLLPAAWRRGRS
jgi:NitT/TauT family transport system permease protein